MLRFGKLLRRMRGWLCYVVLCGVSLLWLSSSLFGVALEMHGRRVCGLEEGCVVVYTDTTSRSQISSPGSFTLSAFDEDQGIPAGPPPAWELVSFRPLETHTLARRMGLIGIGKDIGAYQNSYDLFFVEVLNVPLWPFVLLAGGFAHARTGWWRGRGHPAPACKSCGYNLTGNVSGMCPECGTPVAEDVRVELAKRTGGGSGS